MSSRLQELLRARAKTANEEVARIRSEGKLTQASCVERLGTQLARVHTPKCWWMAHTAEAFATLSSCPIPRGAPNWLEYGTKVDKMVLTAKKSNQNLLFTFKLQVGDDETVVTEEIDTGAIHDALAEMCSGTCSLTVAQRRSTDGRCTDIEMWLKPQHVLVRMELVLSAVSDKHVSVLLNEFIFFRCFK
jgi:hypothetical protein